MPIHRDLINAAKNKSSLRSAHLNETGRAIGRALTEIHSSHFAEISIFDDLLKRLDEAEQKEK